MHTVQRTLVKSPPELWADLSDPDSLARRLDAFGPVTITDLRPESRVAWAADALEGVVELEPSGWGTRVTLSAATVEPEPDEVADAQPVAEPEAEAEAQLAEPRPARPGLLTRLWRSLTRAEIPAPGPPAPTPAPPSPAPAPGPPAPPSPTPPQIAHDAGRTEAVLSGVLDDLGAAHHRPFSR